MTASASASPVPTVPPPSIRDAVRAGAAVTGRVPIPAIRGLPVLGSALEFRRDRLGLLAQVAALGPIARYQLGPVPVHMVTDGALAHQILVEQADGFMKS